MLESRFCFGIVLKLRCCCLKFFFRISHFEFVLLAFVFFEIFYVSSESSRGASTKLKGSGFLYLVMLVMLSIN